MNKKSSSRRRYPEAGKKNEAPFRVAEPATAVYSVTKSSTIRKPPRTSVKRIAGYAVSNEVGQFAVASDLIPHLKTAIRLVRACFPTVRKIDFEYIIDPEIENAESLKRFLIRMIR